MMKRKLVKQGLRALTITLPSSWIQKNNLEAGNEIDLIESDGVLTISTENKQPIKDISVDISGLLPRLADRFMARAYQKGYDKLTINFDDPELMLAIKNKIPELMGFELMDIGENKLDIQVISTENDLDFDTILRKAFLILMDMLETCHTAWKENDKKTLENLFHKDFNVNRFTYFCLRDLNKSQKRMDFGRSILYYLIESSEDLGDELKQLGKILAKTEPHKETLNALEKLNELFRISYEFFYKPDKKAAVKAFKLYKEILSMIDEGLENKDKNIVKSLISIESSAKIIYHLTTMRLDTLEELKGSESIKPNSL